MASGSDVSNGVSGIPGDLPEYATLPSHAGLRGGGPTNSLATRGTKMNDMNDKVVDVKEVKVKETIIEKKKNDLEDVGVKLKIPDTLDKISKDGADGSGSLKIERKTSEAEAASSKTVNDSPGTLEVKLKTPEFLDKVKDSSKNAHSLEIKPKLSEAEALASQASNSSLEIPKIQVKISELLDKGKDSVEDSVPLKTEKASKVEVNDRKLRSSGRKRISEAEESSLKSKGGTLNNLDSNQGVSTSAESLHSEPNTSEASSSKRRRKTSVSAENLNKQDEVKGDSYSLKIDENRSEDGKEDEIKNSVSPANKPTTDFGVSTTQEDTNKRKLRSSGTKNVSEASALKSKDDAQSNLDSLKGVPTSAETSQTLDEDEKISKQSEVRKNTLNSESSSIEDEISGNEKDSSGLDEFQKNVSASEGCSETNMPPSELTGRKRRNQERWYKLLDEKQEKQAEKRKLLEATNDTNTDEKTAENPDLLPEVPESAESCLSKEASSSEEKCSIASTQIENTSKPSEPLENKSEQAPVVKKRKISDLAEEDKLGENSNLTKEKESRSAEIEPSAEALQIEAGDENSSKQFELKTSDPNNLSLEDRNEISEIQDSSGLADPAKNLPAVGGGLETDRPLLTRKQRRNHVKWLKNQLKKKLAAEQNAAEASNNPKTDENTSENPDFLAKVPETANIPIKDSETAESSLPNVASSSEEKCSTESTQIADSAKPSEPLENKSEHAPVVKKRKISDLAEEDKLEENSNLTQEEESTSAEIEPTSADALQIKAEDEDISKQFEVKKSDSENLSLEDRNTISGTQDSSGLADPAKNLPAAGGGSGTYKLPEGNLTRKQRRNHVKWLKKQHKRKLAAEQNAAEASNNPKTDENTSENSDLLAKVPETANIPVKVSETAESVLPNVASSSEEKCSTESTQIADSSKPSEPLENKSEQAPVVKKKKKSRKKNKNKGLQQGVTQPASSAGNIWVNGIGNPSNTSIYRPPLLPNTSNFPFYGTNLLHNSSLLGNPPLLRNQSISPSFHGIRLPNQSLSGSLPALPPVQANLLQNQGNSAKNSQPVPLMQVKLGSQSSSSQNIPNQTQNQGIQISPPASRYQVRPQSSYDYYMGSSINEAGYSRNELYQARIEESLYAYRHQSSMRMEAHLSGYQDHHHSSSRDYLSLSRNEASTSRYQGDLWDLPRHQENLEYPPKHHTNPSQNEASPLPSTSRTQEQARDSHNSRDQSLKKRGCKKSRDSPSHSPHDNKRFRASEKDSSFRENGLTRVIISENFVGLEIEELMYVRISISHEIDKIQTGSTPRFNNTYLESGGIVVESADVWSRDWLTERVPKLVPWRGAKLRIVDPPDLEVFHRAVLWIPGLVENAEIVLTRLERQNPGLTTGNWRVYCGEEKFDPRGYNLIVGIPDKCVESLKGLDFKPYLGMSRVAITLTPSEDQKEKKSSSPRR